MTDDQRKAWDHLVSMCGGFGDPRRPTGGFGTVPRLTACTLRFILTIDSIGCAKGG